MAQLNYRNRLLREIAPEPFAALEAHLTPVQLTLGRSFEEPGALIGGVCFPERGVVSVVARTKEGAQTEVGLIGAEGVTGSATFLGDSLSVHQAFVQVEGTGSLVAVDVVRELCARFPTFRATMLLYVQAFHVQVAHTALTYSRGKVDVRLARWLLMAADRSSDRDMPLTHELLALMLGVRRPGVTDAIHRLEGDQLIKAQRAKITITDRVGLEARAGSYYGGPEAEYERLLGKLATAAVVDSPR